VADHCLRSTSYVNLIVIDKQPQLQYLSIDDAVEHCSRGAGIWPWAGTDDDRFRVRGFIEEGTTPFNMAVRNRVSRYHLVMDALNNARRTPPGASALKTWCEQPLAEHATYVVEHLQDLLAVRDWTLDSSPVE
jgi:phosphoketolase